MWVLGASLQGYYKGGLPWQSPALLNGTGSTCFITIVCHSPPSHHAQVAALPWALGFPLVSLGHQPRPGGSGFWSLQWELHTAQTRALGGRSPEREGNARGSEYPPSERWTPRLPMKTQHSDPGLCWPDDRWQSFCSYSYASMNSSMDAFHSFMQAQGWQAQARAGSGRGMRSSRS